MHSFGIGHGCSKHLIQGLAAAGRGSSCIIEDTRYGDLEAKVIESLQKATQPSLQNCKITWTGIGTKQLGEVFRN
jgi:hypothetical protein